MTRLYRPVGLEELSLIWDVDCREFPPRLPEQPIFYPVTSFEYATQIARNWNTKSSSSSGYVTSFDLDDGYLSNFDRHIVGSAVHEEYWIPAAQLADFNEAINGEIEVDAAFFGKLFAGFIPDKCGLKGKNAEEQFVVLARSWDYSRMDFVLEVSINRKAVYLNCLFWLQQDFSKFYVNAENKGAALKGLTQAWTDRQIRPGLPKAFNEGLSNL